MISWQPGVTLEMVEKDTILAAYKYYKGNKTQTALSLDIAVRTLDAKLEKYEADELTERERFERELQKRNDGLAAQRGFPNVKDPQSFSSAQTGVRLESAFGAPTQPKVSLSERSQVQEVLSRPTSKGSVRR